MAGSYPGVNNAKITNKNHAGGNTKQGLAPTGTHYFKANSTGNQYRTKTSIGYTIGATIPPSWKLYRAVGSTTIINGTRLFFN